jgi:hypothetical protein
LLLHKELAYPKTGGISNGKVILFVLLPKESPT